MVRFGLLDYSVNTDMFVSDSFKSVMTREEIGAAVQFYSDQLDRAHERRPLTKGNFRTVAQLVSGLKRSVHNTVASLTADVTTQQEWNVLRNDIFAQIEETRASLRGASGRFHIERNVLADMTRAIDQCVATHYQWPSTS